jgi:hypothetical protein
MPRHLKVGQEIWVLSMGHAARLRVTTKPDATSRMFYADILWSSGRVKSGNHVYHVKEIRPEQEAKRRARLNGDDC